MTIPRVARLTAVQMGRQSTLILRDTFGYAYSADGLNKKDSRLGLGTIEITSNQLPFLARTLSGTL